MLKLLEEKSHGSYVRKARNKSNRKKTLKTIIKNALLKRLRDKISKTTTNLGPNRYENKRIQVIPTLKFQLKT